MKKSLLLLLCIIVLSIMSKAAVHIVRVSDFQFSPANINDVIVGDVIRWEWVSGFHTTTDDPSYFPETSLPPGAATWDAPITSSNRTFEYTVTVAGTYNYVCSPHAPSMAGSFTASGALPIKLSPLTLTASNGRATISWKTLLEQNTDYFSIRRSLNGSVYAEIARIPAAGSSSSERLYSFTDMNISSGKFYYYNIEIVDKDGRREFSETKMVKSEGKIEKLILSLSPNPISRPGHLMMTFNAHRVGKMEVNVVDAQGRSIIKTQMQAYAGVNNGHVHLGALKPGNYTLVCLFNGSKESHKIIFK